MRAKLTRAERPPSEPGPLAPITWRRDGTSAVVSMSGRMTPAQGTRLNETLCKEPWRTTLDLVVDLSGLGGMDPVAANDLLDAYVTMTLRRGSLRVAGLNASVRAALEAVSGPRLVSAIELPGAATGMSRAALRPAHVWRPLGHTPAWRLPIRRRTR